MSPQKSKKAACTFYFKDEELRLDEGEEVYHTNTNMTS